ncbi:MAG TPA: hypothetical protein ENI81_09250 [Phycisphaerales bacterium]|nr:hypothetical protein [Phycisphaerales bacterium]
MKWFGMPLLRGVLGTFLIAVAATGFYWAPESYFARRIRCMRWAASARLRTRRTGESQDLEGSIKSLLPQNWQADWRAGTLCITRYNPNGTVADGLFFDSIGSFCDWAGTHPDFCDLDVDKVAFGARGRGQRRDR